MPFTISEATTADAAGIAAVFASHQSSNFTRLQLGTVNPADLRKDLKERITKSIAETPDQIYVIAKDGETGEVASYAQWFSPKPIGEKVEFKSNEVSRSACFVVPEAVSESCLHVAARGERCRGVAEETVERLQCRTDGRLPPSNPQHARVSIEGQETLP